MFVHKLELKTNKEWLLYCKSGDKPDDIPQKPLRTYRDKWKGIGDWLGTGNVAPKDRSFCSFEKARKFVQRLGLKNNKEWRKYFKSDKIPSDIPTAPDRTYKDGGWISWGDFLGTGAISDRKKVFLSFKEARKFVHKLKLKSQKEWQKYCRLGQRSKNIPGDPYGYYKNKGWIGWRDFLGY